MCPNRTTRPFQPELPYGEIPYGYCHCGCGQKTRIATYTHRTIGYVKGHPMRFVHGHNAAKYRSGGALNPSGLCMCGCGQPAPIAKRRNMRRGIVAGQPLRFIPGHARRRHTEERFWEKVDRRGPDDCWEWLASKSRKGYGNFSANGCAGKAHRYAYELHYGPIPDNMCVCHNCPAGDNPACVNPAHLWLGTINDNNTDRDNKGRDRHPTGEKHWAARFTNSEVREIRKQRFDLGISARKLAKMYGVSLGTMKRILQGKTYHDA
jgi:hypothetical protein